METGLIIAFVGLLVFLAHVFFALFERTRVPDVLYLIIIGVLVGPVLELVHPDDFGKIGPVFTTIALVLILFEGGMELGFETLRRSLRGTLAITGLSYVLALGLLLAALMTLTNLSLGNAAFVAAVLAGPAPALVIPLARSLGMREHSRTTLTLESALGEALCILTALAILESQRVQEVQVGKVLGSLLASFLFALIFGVSGGFFWSLLLNRIRELQHAMFTTPAFVFVVYGITEFLGFSGPVAALAFGITMGNAGLLSFNLLTRITSLSPIHHNEVEKGFFGEIVFLLKTFFFVYLGLSLRLTDVITASVAAALILALLLSRLVSVRLSTTRTDTSLADARLMSLLIPKGTAAVVLGSLLVQEGMEGALAVQEVIYAVVAASIIATSAGIFLAAKTRVMNVLNVFFPGYGADPTS